MNAQAATLSLPRTWVAPTLTEHGPLAALAHVTAHRARFQSSPRSCRSRLAASRTRRPATPERDAVTPAPARPRRVWRTGLRPRTPIRSEPSAIQIHSWTCVRRTCQPEWSWTMYHVPRTRTPRRSSSAPTLGPARTCRRPRSMLSPMPPSGAAASGEIVPRCNAVGRRTSDSAPGAPSPRPSASAGRRRSRAWHPAPDAAHADRRIPEVRSWPTPRRGRASRRAT